MKKRSSRREGQQCSSSQQRAERADIVSIFPAACCMFLCRGGHCWPGRRRRPRAVVLSQCVIKTPCLRLSSHTITETRGTEEEMKLIGRKVARLFVIQARFPGRRLEDVPVFVPGVITNEFEDTETFSVLFADGDLIELDVRGGSAVFFPVCLFLCHLSQACTPLTSCLLWLCEWNGPSAQLYDLPELEEAFQVHFGDGASQTAGAERSCLD